MLKILYAASDNLNSKIQLSRFLKAIEGKPYIIKIAAYKNSSPSVNIDWTLDSLLNMFNPNIIYLDNDNLKIYYQQIKSFAPDLIISDLEYFTSYIANILNIPLWHCSSSLIRYGVTLGTKNNVGLFKHYNFIFNRQSDHSVRIINIIDNANYNFVYSHLGDIENGPLLQSKFDWIRPYYPEGKISIPCQRNIIAASLFNNKNILSLIKKYPDCVSFSEFEQEEYENILLKDINNMEEYACNLKNSNLFVCEGQTNFLADAYYNNKYSIVFPNLKDPECIINSSFSEKYKLSTLIYNAKEDISDFFNKEIISTKKDNIKFLHEKIMEL